MDKEIEKLTEENITETAKEKRNYKDSVLIDLFCEDITAKENQLSLFNALHNTHFTMDEVKITDIRIPDAIYMNFRNDMAMDFNNRIVILSEHQSTINNNMPLRQLMHIGRTYESMVPVKTRYKRKMVQIPRPEFYVLYNGKDPVEPESVLKLSDAYIKGDALGKNTDDKIIKDTENNLDRTVESSLELVVKVIDINSDSKADVLRKCPILKEYAQFVSCVRYHKELGEEDAMEQAIKECIERNILKDYLLRRGAEVVNMLCAEYDYDMDMAVQKEESYEDGFTDGFSKGVEDGFSRGIADEKRAIAKNLLKQGINEKAILSSTGLTKEELEKLK